MILPCVEPWASIVEKVLSKFGNATKKIAEIKKLDLLGKKKNVVEAITKIKNPIIVIIDDIDRLTPSEAFQVLRLVKAVADFSGTSFLLAFDANYLASVLNKNNIDNSSEYINKIIQLRVPLPVISDRSMNELANIEFENLSEKNLTEPFESDEERLSWIYHNYFKHLISNPRELKRCFNHLKFVLAQVEGEVCFTDLFALSIIATKANLVYEHIKRTPEAYIGKRFSNDGLMMEKQEDIIKSFEDERSKLFSSFDKKENKLIIGLLGEIFPALDSGGFAHYGVSDNDAAGRVSAPQRLYIAFHYITPEGYISDQEIMQYISGEIDRTEFLENVLDEDSDERFFEMMKHYSSKCKNNSFDIISSIYDVFLKSDKLKKSLECNYGFMSRDLYRQINWLTNKIISESELKFELIESLVKRIEYAPLSADILYKTRVQIKEKYSEEPWVSDNQLDELELKFQNASIEALKQKLFFDNHLESHIFFGLRRSSKEKAKELLTNIMNDDNGIIRVAEIIGNTGSDSTNGPFVEITDNNFSDTIDLNALRELAKSVDLTQQTVSVKATLNSIIDGSLYYLKDGTKGENW